MPLPLLLLLLGTVMHGSASADTLLVDTLDTQHTAAVMSLLRQQGGSRLWPYSCTGTAEKPAYSQTYRYVQYY